MTDRRAERQPRKRPNIVLIMTDQHRWDALGRTSSGRVETPNLDALADQGCHFKQAFVPTPLCTPSRICMLKSRYANQHGVRTNEFGPIKEPGDTLPALLHESGYHTALIGKDHAFDAGAHFGLDQAWDNAELSERDKFFDYVRLFDHFGRNPRPGAEEETPSDAAVREFRKHHMTTKFLDSEPFSADEEVTRRMTDLAIEFLKDNSQRDDPFFLWLSYPDPHPPFVVAEPYASMYKSRDVGSPTTCEDEYGRAAPRVGLASRLMKMQEYSASDIRRIRELYFGMVSFIDEEVGRLRAHLDRIGRGDDTYIVFTADHGEYLGDHGMVRKSVALYDCLVRVPLIVSGPGIAPGASSNFLASSLDITPTLLDFASVPDSHRREGLSLASHLRGGPAPERPHVFGTFGVAGHAITQAEVEALDFDYLFEHPYVWGSWVSPLTMRGRAIMVRGQNAKLVVHEGGFRELYDLARDPDELRNIYGSDDTTHLERELMSALADWLLSQVPDVPPYEATWP